MKNLFTKAGKELLTMTKMALIALLVVGGVVYAQTTFTQPSQNPPGGNVSAPINVGATSQAKAGNLAANAIAGQWVQGTAGLCIGPNASTGNEASCITQWPAGGSGGGGASSIYIHEQVISSGLQSFPARVDCPVDWTRTGCSGGVDTTSKRDVHAVPTGFRGCQMRINRNRQGTVWAHCIRLADEPQASPVPAPTPPPSFYDEDDFGSNDDQLRILQ